MTAGQFSMVSAQFHTNLPRAAPKPLATSTNISTIEVGPQGVVGETADTLALAPTTLTFHLKALRHATLVSVVQKGRFQRCRANLPLMQDLIAYLTAEYWSGQ